MALDGEIAAAFQQQAKACRALGSPFTAHICTRLVVLLDAATRLGRTVTEWPLDPVSSALALRLCGALNWLARSGRAPELTAAYPPATASGPTFDDTLRAAIAQHGGDLIALLQSAPQTNEVARSAILLGGLLTIAHDTGLPLALSEIGASAGLNLHADRYAYRFGPGLGWGPPNAPLTIACDWRGTPPPLDTPLRIASRAGADLAPIDPADPEARDRLLAYIWPDQSTRLKRTDAALAHAAANPVNIERAEAADWIEALLAQPPRHGLTRVLMHSITWQYFPRATQDRIAAALSEAGTHATQQTPLAWLRLEPDTTPGTAAILLTLWPGGQTRELGRGDYHGRFAHWNGC